MCFVCLSLCQTGQGDKFILGGVRVWWGEEARGTGSCWRGGGQRDR